MNRTEKIELLEKKLEVYSLMDCPEMAENVQQQLNKLKKGDGV